MERRRVDEDYDLFEYSYAPRNVVNFVETPAELKTIIIQAVRREE